MSDPRDPSFTSTSPPPPAQPRSSLGQQPNRLARIFGRWFHPERDDTSGLPRHVGWEVWILITLFAVAVHVFMWSVVHVEADMRVCMGHLPDPLFALIPFNRWWWWITKTTYMSVVAVSLVLFFLQAGTGDHRSLTRWGLAIGFSGVQRCITLWLIPLCRWSLPAGTRKFTEAPTVDLFFFKLPWRPFAANDLVFSGHVAETILVLLATRSWPRPLRAFLWAFQIAQIYGLIATRGHYTLDIVLAFPCAYFADLIAVGILRRYETWRRAVPAGA